MKNEAQTKAKILIKIDKMNGWRVMDHISNLYQIGAKYFKLKSYSPLKNQINCSNGH